MGRLEIAAVLLLYIVTEQIRPMDCCHTAIRSDNLPATRLAGLPKYQTKLLPKLLASSLGVWPACVNARPDLPSLL